MLNGNLFHGKFENPLDKPTIHGETLLVMIKSLNQDYGNSLVLFVTLLGTHVSMRIGEMNITVLDKEFFRRKGPKESNI